MDVSNLARVFGPTIVGHATPNPDPMTILQDTKRQPRVSRFISTAVGRKASRVAAPFIPDLEDHLHPLEGVLLCLLPQNRVFLKTLANIYSVYCNNATF